MLKEGWHSAGQGNTRFTRALSRLPVSTVPSRWPRKRRCSVRPAGQQAGCRDGGRMGGSI